ncbi:MAG: glycerophosphodiester phosphodiesterase family protein, partial [Clostridia bacterium]|nr:glycerophosphodiester phosphodiesterase family protein [Clostridia bacterium]
MKKRILSLILAVVTVLATVPFAVTAGMDEYPIPDYGPQAQGNAAERFERGEVISVAHRAVWRHGPENSLVSIAAAIEIGVDAVELDVALTKDKVLVLFHDATINRTVWRDTGKVSDYTWDEMSEMVLEQGQGGSEKAYRLTEWDAQVLNGLSDYALHSGSAAEVGGTMPPTRMDDAIELIDKRVMINLDKCTTEELFVACYVLFRETDMLDHVFFKNSVSATTLATWCESAASAWSEKYPDEPLTM